MSAKPVGCESEVPLLETTTRGPSNASSSRRPRVLSAGALTALTVSLLSPSALGEGTAPSAEHAGTTGAPGVKSAPAVPPAPSVLDEVDRRLLKGLEARKAALDDREREIARREVRAQAAEQALVARVSELTRLRQEIDTLLTQERNAADARVQSLATTLREGMKVDQASAILSRMDDELAVRVMNLIPASELGKFLEKMDKDRAAKLVTAYARRRSEVVDAARKQGLP